MKSGRNRSRKTRKRKKFVPPPKMKGGTNNKRLSTMTKCLLIAFGVLVFIVLLMLSTVLSNMGVSKEHVP
ncbi:hypothetical protein [Sphingobacterium sp. UME9]|uniref:hypothetical protein n=1 Tax=Sphingobacterium sp. UME9 TaxID=1862316 RepID=UPI0015FEF5E3|nr:hypothetical protein [Sphingobacterium sp. UME9]